MSNMDNNCSNNKEECFLDHLPDAQQISSIIQSSGNSKSENEIIRQSTISTDQVPPQEKKEKTSENANITGNNCIVKMNSQTTAEEINQIISNNNTSTINRIEIDLQSALNSNIQSTQHPSINSDSLILSLEKLNSIEIIQSLSITCNQNLTQISFLRSLLSLISTHRSQLLDLSLDFSNSNSSTETLSHISESLISLSNLQTFSLNLGNNPINKAKELGKLGKRISNESSISQLTTLELNLSGMHLGHANLRDYSQFILNNCNTLSVLDLYLSGCNIEKKGIEAIKHWIMHMKKIEKLDIDISTNGLMDLFVKDMVKGFQGNQMENLKKLKINLRGNYLTNEVMQFISISMSGLSSMVELYLDLSKNQINYIGLIKLVSLVQSAKSLEEFYLNLSGQRGRFVIEDVDEFIMVVKKATKELKKFTLDLSDNMISSGDINRIVECFQNQERKEKEQENQNEQSQFVLQILIEEEVAMESQKQIISKRIIIGKQDNNQ